MRDVARAEAVAAAARSRGADAMLTSFDDYPVHQTAEPIAQPATGDRNFYDRYFFNGYSRAGDLFFAAALGLYPNRRVMDARVQRRARRPAARGPRLAPRADASARETRVGPIFVEVVEPLRALRVRVERQRVRPRGRPGLPRAHGGDRGAALHAGVAEGRLVMDSTRLTQFGRLGGLRSRVDGEEIAIRPDRTPGHARSLVGHPARRRAGGRRARHAAAVLLAVGAGPLRRRAARTSTFNEDADGPALARERQASRRQDGSTRARRRVDGGGRPSRPSGSRARAARAAREITLTPHGRDAAS